jgi:ribosomal protein S18 acetylase RimI-like enzyme
MNVQLRAASPADYGVANELMTELMECEADRRAAFVATLASSAHDLILAEVGGEVVGLAHLMTYDDLTHGAPAGELLGLVVHEGHRGQGIGRVLLEEVCRIARQRGVGELHISTELDNLPAQALYRSIGGEVIGVHMEVDLGGLRNEGKEQGSE